MKDLDAKLETVNALHREALEALVDAIVPPLPVLEEMVRDAIKYGIAVGKNQDGKLERIDPREFYVEGEDDERQI